MKMRQIPLPIEREKLSNDWTRRSAVRWRPSPRGRPCLMLGEVHPVMARAFFRFRPQSGAYRLFKEPNFEGRLRVETGHRIGAAGITSQKGGNRPRRAPGRATRARRRARFRGRIACPRRAASASRELGRGSAAFPARRGGDAVADGTPQPMSCCKGYFVTRAYKS